MPSNKPLPRVSVIVLNWNGRDDTLACIESLRSIDYPDHEVMVVDNGSSDGSVDALRTRFPELEIVETGQNLGFAEGNNVGIRRALARGADYVFLLNNDTVVDPFLLRRLVEAAERCPEGGIFTPKIYYHSQPARIWSAGVRWLEGTMEFQHVQDETQYRFDERGVAATDYACGCALLVKSAILRKVGLLDAKFFLTYEETDLCYRARREGILSYYVPRAVLWHKISVSFGGAESPLIRYFITRNRLLWGERYLHFAQLMQLYKVTWWELHSRFIKRSSSAPPVKNVLQRAREFASGLRERWNEPANQAVAWGALHYVFRRFGDAPPHVRMMARRKGD